MSPRPDGKFDDTVVMSSRVRTRVPVPPNARLGEPADHEWPNTLNVSIDGTAGHDLLAAASRIAASTGSACHSGTHTPSPVLTAMCLGDRRALEAVRLSLGRWITPADITTATEALARAAAPGLSR